MAEGIDGPGPRFRRGTDHRPVVIDRHRSAESCRRLCSVVGFLRALLVGDAGDDVIRRERLQLPPAITLTAVQVRRSAVVAAAGGTDKGHVAAHGDGRPETVVRIAIVACEPPDLDPTSVAALEDIDRPLAIRRGADQ